jgi:hypothetical protein
MERMAFAPHFPITCAWNLKFFAAELKILVSYLRRFRGSERRLGVGNAQ